MKAYKLAHRIEAKAKISGYGKASAMVSGMIAALNLTTDADLGDFEQFLDAVASGDVKASYMPESFNQLF